MTIAAITNANIVVPALFPAASTGILVFTTFANALTSALIRNAFVIRVPKTGTLDWVEWRTGAVSNQPDNGVRVSFQGVDAAGAPDNTDDQFIIMPQPFSANTWQVPAAYMGSTGGGSGTKRSVTAGEFLACVFRLESAVASDSIFIALMNGQNSGLTPAGILEVPQNSTNSGTAWAAAADQAVLALKYDDGSYGFIRDGILPMTTLSSTAFGTGSNPDERGLVFQVPFPARLKGFYISYDSQAVAHDLVLYDATPTAIETLTGSIFQKPGANGGYAYYEFATPRDLTANVNYRITLLPTTASTVVLYEYTFPTQAIREAFDGGPTWMTTHRNNAGAFSNEVTIRPAIHLVFSGFDNGAGGGGGEHSAVF